MKMILRVDDCNGWEESNADKDLEQFKRWRDAFEGWRHNVIYGFVPTLLSTKDLEWLYCNLEPSEILAVHGHNHKRGAQPSLTEMRKDRYDFRTFVYIPPFNAYDREIMQRWGQAGGEILMGGFDKEHHNFGSKETKIGDVWHFNANKDLYDRVGKVVASIDKLEKEETTEVVTLHRTWDQENLFGIKFLGNNYKFESIYEYLD